MEVLRADVCFHHFVASPIVGEALTCPIVTVRSTVNLQLFRVLYPIPAVGARNRPFVDWCSRRAAKMTSTNSSFFSSPAYCLIRSFGVEPVQSAINTPHLPRSVQPSPP